MAAPKSNSSVVTARAKGTIALTPMTLGFASLIDPDTYDPEKPTFKMNGHLTPEGIEGLRTLIEEKVYTEAALEKLHKEAEAGGMKLKKPMEAGEWLGDKLKEPKEKARNQNPHIVISNRAFIGTGEKRRKREIACWSASNKKLNLKKLRLGAGSVVQAIVYPNLYASKVAGSIPQPSLKLVGIRVLKLVQWGGGDRAPDQMDDEDIKNVMGEDFEYDDLEGFAAGTDEPEDDDDEEQDDAPPAPEDQAKGMF